MGVRMSRSFPLSARVVPECTLTPPPLSVDLSASTEVALVSEETREEVRVQWRHLHSYRHHAPSLRGRPAPQRIYCSGVAPILLKRLCAYLDWSETADAASWPHRWSSMGELIAQFPAIVRPTPVAALLDADYTSCVRMSVLAQTLHLQRVCQIYLAHLLLHLDVGRSKEECARRFASAIAGFRPPTPDCLVLSSPPAPHIAWAPADDGDSGGGSDRRSPRWSQQRQAATEPAPSTLATAELV